MTATTSPEAATTPSADTQARSGSLLLAEAHRISARRFNRVLLIVAAVGYIGVVAIMALFIFSKPGPESFANAEAARDQQFARDTAGRERCLREAPADVAPEQFCGPPISPENYQAEDFADPYFSLASGLPNGAVAFGVITAMLTFLIGATYIGAEWSTRSIVALLFWEPRRLRVIAVKLLVTAGAAGLITAATQAVWVGTAQVLARTHGVTGELPAGFWSDLLAQQARCVLLAILTAWLGFSLANLIRNTGAALGIAFVYFVIVENIVSVVRPSLSEWTIVSNVTALLSEGGRTLMVGPGVGQNFEPYEVHLSNVHGALVLGGITAVMVAAGVALFKRRDLH